MTTPTPPPGQHTRPNPARPYKAIASAVVAGAGVLVAQGTDVLPAWAILLLSALVAGLVTFTVPAD